MIRKERAVMFGEACSTCPRKYDCLSATSVASEKRKFFFKLLGKRQPVNDAMKAGKEKHELLQKNLLTLTEFGEKKFHKALLHDETVVIKELMVCSPRNGFRGFIDIAGISMDRKNNVSVFGRELKSGWSNEYLYQMSVYGMILSDPNALTYFVKKGKKRDKNVPMRLYPKMELNLNVDTSIEIFRVDKEGNVGLGKPFKVKFTENNVVSEQVKGWLMQVNRRTKERRRMMEATNFFLEDIPPCKRCGPNREWCSFPDSCCKLNDLNYGKSKQVYFGKNKLLVSTKPKVCVPRVLPMKREGT